MINTRAGVTYEGRFIEFGSKEYKQMMFIEGTKKENEDTLLGLISKIHLEEEDIFDKN